MVFDSTRRYNPWEETPTVEDRIVELIELLELDVDQSEPALAPQLEDYELSIDTPGDTIRVDTEVVEDNMESREGRMLLTLEQTPEPEQPLPTHAKPNSDESRRSQYNPDSTIRLISQ